MKKTILVLLCAFVLMAAGCVGGKIAAKHAFYSTNSPSLTIKSLEGSMEYVGEQSFSNSPVQSHSYFYKNPALSESDESLLEGFWVEFYSLDSGWALEPSLVPGDGNPNTGVYTKRFGGENYNCRTFIATANEDSYIEKYYIDKGFQMNRFDTVRACTRLISPRKKITFGYFAKTNKSSIEKLFLANGILMNKLTDQQIKFFNEFDTKADLKFSIKEYEDGDIKE